MRELENERMRELENEEMRKWGNGGWDCVRGMRLCLRN